MSLYLFVTHRPNNAEVPFDALWAESAQVLFGTADGQVIVMDCHGRMLAHVLLHELDGIISMSWNYPNFLMEDSSESDTDTDDHAKPPGTYMKDPGAHKVTLELNHSIYKHAEAAGALLVNELAGGRLLVLIQHGF